MTDTPKNTSPAPTCAELTAADVAARVAYEREKFGVALSYRERCEEYGSVCWAHGRAKDQCGNACTYHVDEDEIRRRIAPFVTPPVEQSPTKEEGLCAKCGQVRTASGGDVHCSGDCDDFNHDEEGGCHRFAPQPSAEQSVDRPAGQIIRSVAVSETGVPPSAGNLAPGCQFAAVISPVVEESAEPKACERDCPLRVRVVGGLVTITIGVDVLKYAAENGEMWPRLKVKDAEAFAAEVARDLDHDEDERGATQIMKAIDRSIGNVVENGSETVDYDEEAIP